eukprot:11527285-Karenia_brevis.AAC.1
MGNGKRVDGPKAVYFYIWCCLIRHLKNKVTIHENVVSFGTSELEELLGDMFFISMIRVNSEQTGFAQNRPRQFTFIILKQWCAPALKDTEAASISLTDDLQRDFDTLCRRKRRLIMTHHPCPLINITVILIVIIISSNYVSIIIITVIIIIIISTIIIITNHFS